MSRGSTRGEEGTKCYYYYYKYYYYSGNKINLFIHLSPFIQTAIVGYTLC